MKCHVTCKWVHKSLKFICNDNDVTRHTILDFSIDLSTVQSISEQFQLHELIPRTIHMQMRMPLTLIRTYHVNDINSRPANLCKGYLFPFWLLRQINIPRNCTPDYLISILSLISCLEFISGLWSRDCVNMFDLFSIDFAIILNCINSLRLLSSYNYINEPDQSARFYLEDIWQCCRHRPAATGNFFFSYVNNSTF